MKLFVDDLRPVPDGSWTLARTITEAINAIEQFEFEEISLDHDICHHVKVFFIRKGSEVDPRNADMVACTENFKAVAKYLVAKYDRKYISTDDKSLIRPKITIHTMNVVAADELKEILKDFNPEFNLAYRQ
jgi:hypothetical protein